MNQSARCDAMDLDPEKIVFEHFRRQKFMDWIGAELLRVMPGYCTLQLKHREDMAHERTDFHPGVIGALAGSAGEFAALSLMPPDSSLVTIEYKWNLIAAGEGDVLIARAKVIKSGTPVTVCTSEIYVRKDGYQHLCATALMTFIPG